MRVATFGDMCFVAVEKVVEREDKTSLIIALQQILKAHWSSWNARYNVIFTIWCVGLWGSRRSLACEHINKKDRLPFVFGGKTSESEWGETWLLQVLWWHLGFRISVLTKHDRAAFRIAFLWWRWCVWFNRLRLTVSANQRVKQISSSGERAFRRWDVLFWFFGVKRPRWWEQPNEEQAFNKGAAMLATSC